MIAKFVTCDFELMVLLTHQIYRNMELFTIADVSEVCLIMLQNNDLGFRTRFRIKFADKVKHSNISKTDINFNQSVLIMKAFRNAVNDYKVWLAVDLLIQKAIKVDLEGAENVSKEDLMDMINCLAYKEVQSINTWQFLSSRFINCMVSESLELNDLISGVISFKSVAIKSPELYEMICNYFTYKQYTVEDLELYDNNGRIIKFFNSVASMYGA